MDTCQNLLLCNKKLYLLYNSIFKILKINDKLFTNYIVIYFFKNVNKSN